MSRLFYTQTKKYIVVYQVVLVENLETDIIFRGR